MVILALDLAVVGIVAFCGWRGYKNGLIRGVFGIVSLVISLFLANVIAAAYSEEFVDMLKPFVGGVVDSAIVELMEEEEEDEHDISGYEDESDSFITTYTALRRIGLPESPSARIAELATESGDSEGMPAGILSDFVADKLSSVLAFVAVFGIAFILLAIVFAVIGNLVGFIFSLPGLKIIDIIAGALLGIAKGLIIVLTLAAVVRYAGLIAPETIDGTSALKYIVNNNIIADLIGI